MVFTGKAFFRETVGGRPHGSLADRRGTVVLAAFDHDATENIGVVAPKRVEWTFNSIVHEGGVNRPGAGHEDRRCFAAQHDLFRSHLRALAADWTTGGAAVDPNMLMPYVAPPVVPPPPAEGVRLELLQKFSAGFQDGSCVSNRFQGRLKQVKGRKADNAHAKNDLSGIGKIGTGTHQIVWIRRWLSCTNIRARTACKPISNAIVFQE